MYCCIVDKCLCLYAYRSFWVNFYNSWAFKIFFFLFWDQTSGYILGKLPLKWCFIYYRLPQELLTASTSGYLLSMINNFIGHQKIGTTTTIHHTSTLYLNFLSLIPQKIIWWFQRSSTPWMFNKSWQHFESVEVHFSTLLAMASVKGEPQLSRVPQVLLSLVTVCRQTWNLKG